MTGMETGWESKAGNDGLMAPMRLIEEAVTLDQRRAARPRGGGRRPPSWASTP